ncbi:hypothetical protein HDE_00957 [Halotydeus destructor]|nr:hypothetical protein HDE_00957 [Halotydeus destructor]
MKSTSSKNSKRLSQALNETEQWFKSKLGNNSNSSSDRTSATSGSKASETNSILAKATGSSALLAVGSLVLQQVSNPETDCIQASDHQSRSFIIPTIEITEA